MRRLFSAFLLALALLLPERTAQAGYCPEIGRWISRDPIGESAGSNLYSYVLNNPVNLWDPLGLWTFGFGGQASGGLGAGAQGSLGIYIGKQSGSGLFSGWSAGILGSLGGGFYLGAGGSAGGFLQFTNADYVGQLKGVGYEIGLSAGEELCVGVEKMGAINTSIEFSKVGPYLESASWGPTGWNINVGLGGGPLPVAINAFGMWSFGPTVGP